MDPDWLAEEPLAGLVAKGENYSEADKAVLFAEHTRLINEVIPVHRQLQDAGQIEVTMTPFAHPILPLLVSTDLALEASAHLELPGADFTYGQDAVAQIDLGVELIRRAFWDVAPRVCGLPKARWLRKSSAWFPGLASSGWPRMRVCWQAAWA